MIDLTPKLGEINGIEHNEGRHISSNQVILDCIMPSIPLKHKCLSIILIWVIVSLKKNIKKIYLYFFTFLYLGKTDMVLEKRWLFSIRNGAEIRSLEMGRKSPGSQWVDTPWYVTCRESYLQFLPISMSMSSTVNKTLLASSTTIVHKQYDSLSYFHVVVSIGELNLPEGPFRTPPHTVSSLKTKT